VNGGVDGGVRGVVGLYRVVLAPFVVLAFGATVSLFGLPTETDRYFAWTIAPPLTAALLGAAYGGTVVLFVLIRRERTWAATRLAVTAPLALSTALLVATLLHLDRFHLDEGGLSGFIAWVWLIVYVLVPPLLVAVLVLERRLAAGDPPRTAPLPSAIRVVLVVFGAAALLVGAALFAWPTQLDEHWPWDLTALTGRAVASWFLGTGVAAVHAAVEDDLGRLRAASPALAVIGVLGLLAVLRFPDDLHGGAATVATVAVLAGLALLGLAGTLLERRRQGASPS